MVVGWAGCVVVAVGWVKVGWMGWVKVGWVGCGISSFVGVLWVGKGSG